VFASEFDGQVTIVRPAAPAAWVDFFDEYPRFEQTDLDGDGEPEWQATNGAGETIVGASFSSRDVFITRTVINVDLDGEES